MKKLLFVPVCLAVVGCGMASDDEITPIAGAKADQSATDTWSRGHGKVINGVTVAGTLAPGQRVNIFTADSTQVPPDGQLTAFSYSVRVLSSGAAVEVLDERAAVMSTHTAEQVTAGNGVFPAMVDGNPKPVYSFFCVKSFAETSDLDLLMLQASGSSSVEVELRVEWAPCRLTEPAQNELCREVQSRYAASISEAFKSQAGLDIATMSDAQICDGTAATKLARPQLPPLPPQYR